MDFNIIQSRQQLVGAVIFWFPQTQSSEIEIQINEVTTIRFYTTPTNHNEMAKEVSGNVTHSTDDTERVPHDLSCVKEGP
jgi:hypothetical protein